MTGVDWQRLRRYGDLSKTRAYNLALNFTNHDYGDIEEATYEALHLFLPLLDVAEAAQRFGDLDTTASFSELRAALDRLAEAAGANR